MSRNVEIPVPLEELAGKVAFITGGSSGIGLGIARACAEAGMDVVITYLTESHRESAERVLRGTHCRFLSLKVDVTDKDSVADAEREVYRTVGAVNLLCTNAGIGITSPICEATPDDWDDAIGVNLRGVINCLDSFLKRMIREGEPAHVLATASMSGLIHGARAGVYTATKFAVVGLMEALRAELTPRGIGVSVLCPGLVASRIGLSQRNRRRKAALDDRQPCSASSPGNASTELLKAGMSPLEVGRKALKGVRRNDLFIITHPEFERGMRLRCEVLMASVPKSGSKPSESRLRAEASVLSSEMYDLELEKLTRSCGN